MKTKSLFEIIKSTFNSSRRKIATGLFGLSLLASNALAQNTLSNQEISSYTNLNVGKTSTTILVSQTEKAKPKFNKNGQYSVYATPDVRFPTSQELMDNNLDSNTAYAVFAVNPKDVSKYPFAGVSLYKNGKEVAFGVNKSSNAIFIPVLDLLNADSYKRFAIDNNETIIASFKGKLDLTAVENSNLDDILQKQDRLQYEALHPELSHNGGVNGVMGVDFDNSFEVSESDSSSNATDVSLKNLNSDTASYVLEKAKLEKSKTDTLPTPDSLSVLENAEDSLVLVDSLANIQDITDSLNRKSSRNIPTIYFNLTTNGSLGDANDSKGGFLQERYDPFFTGGAKFGVQTGVLFDLTNSLKLKTGLSYDRTSGENATYGWYFDADNVSLDLSTVYVPLSSKIISPELFAGLGLTYFDATSRFLDGSMIDNESGLTPYASAGLGVRIELSDYLNLVLEGSTRVNFSDNLDAKSQGNGVVNNDWSNFVGVGLEIKLDREKADRLAKVRGDSLYGSNQRLAKELGFETYDVTDTVQQQVLRDTLGQMIQYEPTVVTKSMDLDSIAQTFTYDNAKSVVDTYTHKTVKEAKAVLSTFNLIVNDNQFYNLIDAFSRNFDFENEERVKAPKSRMQKDGSMLKLRKSNSDALNVYGLN